MRSASADPPFEDRRQSFGAIADSYDAYRPGYPAAALGWVLDGLTTGSGGLSVVDVGAGTGALTRVVETLVDRVIAVEPDDGMLAALRLRSPKVETYIGRAEDLPLGDASVDVIVAGQAWHWFDPELAAAEFARVLRPGGVIGLLWNIRDDRQSWVRSISDIVGGEDCVRAARGQERVGQALASEVGPVERAEFPNDLSLTPEALVGLVATLSYVRLRTDGDRILDAVRDLTATHPDLAGRDTFDLPHLTETYRARKG